MSNRTATRRSSPPVASRICCGVAMLVALGSLSTGARRESRFTRLELLDGARPILLEQARKRTVGEQPAARLAGRAIVRFVLGVDDALDGRAAHRTGLAVAAVNGHVLAERGYLLGEAALRVVTQALDPFLEDLTRGCEQQLDVCLGHRVGQLHGRDLRPVQDLVAVRVADAGK